MTTEIKKELSNEDIELLETELKIQQHTAVKIYKADESNAVELGKALLQVRKVMKALGKGEFGKWLADNDIKVARANYCIQRVEGKRDRKAKPALNPAYTPELIAVDCFTNMRAAAEEADVDEVKLLAENLRAEIHRMEAAIKHYQQIAEARAKIKAELDAVAVDSFRQVTPEVTATATA